ncbi:MAG TPA: glycine--tRNA ligase [Candidatus Paceibacterota bacterium]|jgi:glycyl-tRNA synthetase|nr:glycine--tRNA ligase [Parcubacteria group bacterium]MDP6119689.1 glycine--tRNA ligase [Candidatus Paceibacterota bacterium]HJN62787.1 glycine--tRNA ligase [Candidatus Paceibacterota bacterium]|tara:strand:+ start:1679 stop:2974 length:1296 start_codon:yes stop_codon:yes gene_type:complete
MSDVSMEKLVSLAKRRGFIYPGSEIYGGLAGTWDYGHYGSLLAYNIKDLWWKHFVEERDDNFAMTTPTLMSEAVWQASGHLDGFADPLIECNKCKHRFRGDQLEDKKKCPDCGGKLGEEKAFNLMLPVQLGSVEGKSNTAYLRGELAQGMFVNFKNTLDTLRPKLPFGLAQIGRAYRNEISPRDFLFRVREFDLMEFEYFVKEADWEKYFEMWKKEMWKWIERVGIKKNMVSELEVPEKDRAHYSKRTVDFEFDYPFGTKELYGLAYRTDYDLKKHAKASGLDLTYSDEEGNKFIPHVVEPTFGHGRTILAVMLSAYNEDKERVWLSFKPEVAPIKVAVFPLLRNKPELVEKADEIYKSVKSYIPNTLWDDNGNVGKRYRRQDEIGTPLCITIDFETLEDKAVTVRDRDSMAQQRVKLDELENYLKKKLNG